MPVTPYMLLDLPTVEETTGPEYAEMQNDAAYVVDAHDHTSGKGVPVPSSGININADLDFQQWAAINLESTQYVTQSAEPDGTYMTYFLDDDFYVVDGNGVSIRITENGAISAASFGGITGLVAPASASFATDTFTWLYDTGKYALMASGPLLLRRDGETNPNRIKVTPPASLASGYDLTLPGALPVANAYWNVSSTGTVSFNSTALASSVDTASIQALAVTSAKLATDSVTTAKITALNVTRAKIEAVGQAVSSSDSVLVAGTATSFTAVTNFTVSLTVDTLRPIIIMCYSSTTGGTISSYGLTAGKYTNYRVRASGASGTSYINDVILYSYEPNTTVWQPAASLNCVFVPTVIGAHTFAVYYAVSGADTETGCSGNRILAYQL